MHNWKATFVITLQNIEFKTYILENYKKMWSFNLVTMCKKNKLLGGKKVTNENNNLVEHSI